MHLPVSKEISVEVEHVKAHRTKKDKKDTSRFEKFVTDGSEKADWAGEGRCDFGRRIYGGSESKDGAAGTRGSICSLAVCSEFSLFGRRLEGLRRTHAEAKRKVDFVDKNREEMKHRTEWCAQVNKYRCMRCARGSKCMMMSGKCTGHKFLSENFGKWRKRHLRSHDLVRRVDRQGEILVWCRKCSGNARQRLGPKLMNCCKLEQVGAKEHGKMLSRIQILEDGRVFAKKAKN